LNDGAPRRGFTRFDSSKRGGVDGNRYARVRRSGNENFLVICRDYNIVVVNMIRRIVDVLTILKRLEQLCAGFDQLLGGGEVVMFRWADTVPNKKSNGRCDGVRISANALWVDICVMSLVGDRMSVQTTSVQVDWRYLMTYSVL
jgi:hypothetical protein